MSTAESKSNYNYFSSSDFKRKKLIVSPFRFDSTDFSSEKESVGSLELEIENSKIIYEQ